MAAGGEQPRVDFPAQLAEAAKMKEDGVKLFKEGNMAEAQRKFAYAMLSTKAMLPKGSGSSDGGAMGGMGGMMGGMMGNLDPQVPEHMREDVIALHCGLLNNMASILMNSGKLERAISRLTETLDLCPNDTTALSRRAKAYWKANKQALCERDVETLLRLEPENAAGLKLKKQLDAKSAEYEQRQKAMFKGMFS